MVVCGEAGVKEGGGMAGAPARRPRFAPRRISIAVAVRPTDD